MKQENKYIQQLWRNQIKQPDQQYFGRDDIYNSRQVVINQTQNHQMKSPIQSLSQEKVVYNGMQGHQYAQNNIFLQQLRTQNQEPLPQHIVQLQKASQKNLQCQESQERKRTNNHLRSFQQDFRQLQQRSSSNNQRMAAQNQRFVTQSPQTPQFHMKMKQHYQVKQQQQISPENPSSQKQEQRSNMFNNLIIQKKADGIRSSQQLVEAAEQIMLQRHFHLQQLSNDFKQKKLDQKSFQQAVATANVYYNQHQMQLRKQSEDHYNQQEFQDYLAQQQQKQEIIQFAHSKKQRELLKAKEFSQNVQTESPQQVVQIEQEKIEEPPKREENAKREESCKRDEKNLSEQETGATINRGVSIDSSDSEVGLKAKKLSSMNEDQVLSKVSEEEKFCESEGDADQDIISEESNDEGVDPNAYGDEDGSETEAEAPPPKKPQYFKKKPTVMQIEEVQREKKPGVPRAPHRMKKEEREAAKAKEKASKPNKKCNKLLASMPDNWEAEEAKFFELNYDYNPQFVYDSPATNKRFLKMFPAPKYEYLPQAKQIIDKFLEIFGTESNYFESEGRQLSDKDEVEQIIWDYLDEHGPDVREVARIKFSTKNVASTSVTYDNWTNKIRINVQLPIQYREGRMRGILHHEIGSHFLRRFNEVQQPWHNERKKFGIKSCITIEEGSGCINMFLEQSKDPKKWCFLFKPALNYYMCCKASELSFKDLFNDLEKYVDNPRQRYKYVLRVKRGLADTSQPGGLYKDQVYLEGALKLLEHRNEVDWHGFYSAKLNIEDLNRPRLMKKLKKSDIVLPKFVQNVDEYKKCLDVIAKHNFID